MRRRRLTKQQVADQPYEVWNAFVHLIGMEEYDDLTPEQRPAHLVFWYENEVQNGGHLQFFENTCIRYREESGRYFEATVLALGFLGATCQQEVLREAATVWASRPRQRIETAEEYCEVALEREFESFDKRFHACEPNLMECLEAHLKQHQDWYIVVE